MSRLFNLLNNDPFFNTSLLDDDWPFTTRRQPHHRQYQMLDPFYIEYLPTSFLKRNPHYQQQQQKSQMTEEEHIENEYQKLKKLRKLKKQEWETKKQHQRFDNLWNHEFFDDLKKKENQPNASNPEQQQKAETDVKVEKKTEEEQKQIEKQEQEQSSKAFDVITNLQKLTLEKPEEISKKLSEKVEQLKSNGYEVVENSNQKEDKDYIIMGKKTNKDGKNNEKFVTMIDKQNPNAKYTSYQKQSEHSDGNTYMKSFSEYSFKTC